MADIVNLGAILLGLLFLQKRHGRADDAEETFSATGVLKPIPDALRKLPEVVADVSPGCSPSLPAVVAAIVAVPFVAGPGTTLEYTGALVFGIIAISLVVLTGWSGNVSLGQFAFAGVGGVLAGDLIEKANVDLFFCLAAGGRRERCSPSSWSPGLRIEGAYLAAVTLALGVAMNSFILNPTFLPQRSSRSSTCAACSSGVSICPATAPSTSCVWPSWF